MRPPSHVVRVRVTTGPLASCFVNLQGRRWRQPSLAQVSGLPERANLHTFYAELKPRRAERGSRGRARGPGTEVLTVSACARYYPSNQSLTSDATATGCTAAVTLP
ncbi:hypothetical protein [Myxococcus sp. RHSTA-1-4]|uniref:hypothetical protein n=1 Tax=Myxococcus sp. RHSTA-1-4 TaxID=2874601 RepID=UPI001CBB38AB|nr:hypothetical protein [Myxococcus sp. RHSTA-1-4]MBZ4420568.1 hypothetical protein [Myxococcus sp. RHSTA-1-4]